MLAGLGTIAVQRQVGEQRLLPLAANASDGNAVVDEAELAQQVQLVHGAYCFPREGLGTMGGVHSVPASVP